MVKNTSMREETRCRHYMGYSFDWQQGIFNISHPTDRIASYHDFYYTSRGALAETGNSSMCPLRGIDRTIIRTMNGATSHFRIEKELILCMKGKNNKDKTNKQKPNNPPKPPKHTPQKNKKNKNQLKNPS